MEDDDRVWRVKDLLAEYARSPSLRHIRDPNSLHKLAREIVSRLDRSTSIWTKWGGLREVIAKSAIGCWIPIEDLREFLNRLTGPQLTLTDVAQRMAGLEEEDPYAYSRTELQHGCLAIYEREKIEGTDLPAIIGVLRGHVALEEKRLSFEQEQGYREYREKVRIARQQRLLSGADCGWTQLDGSRCWYCRANGRAYRLSSARDKRWHLHRVNSFASDEGGVSIGTYGERGDASKAVARIAYHPERR